MWRHRPFGAAVAALVVAVLSACGGSPAGPSGTPSATPSASSPQPAPPTPPVAAAVFRPCDQAGFECATVPAPVDAAHPAGPTIPVAIVRLPAQDPAHKVGTLLVNPGGPGGSGIDFAEQTPWPAELRQRFDIVGFDPRGVGRSTALDCGIPSSSLQEGDPDANDPADVTATEQAVDRYTAACGQRNGALLPHLGTADVARDMDRIRAALGQPQISYLGFSYGTSIGQTYARMYPDKLRTWVVDGVVDQSASGVDAATAQTRSFEGALDAFAADCTHTPTCPIGPDPIGVVNRLQARLHQGPVPVPGAPLIPGAPSSLSEGQFEIALGAPLYEKEEWPLLQRSLALADRRQDFRALAALALSYDQEANLQLLDAVNCLDSTWTRDRSQAVDQARAIEAGSPHFAGGGLTSTLTCAAWPTPAQPLDATPPTTAVRPIVVGTTNDPATPYQNSVTLARSLPGATLVTYRGDGHTAYLREVGPCVDDPITRYLVDGTRPPGDVTC
ncbi:alpha/beta hydrolase [Actinomycetospora sp. C-140]